jgi:hypothetical protein
MCARDRFLTPFIGRNQGWFDAKGLGNTVRRQPKCPTLTSDAPGHMLIDRRHHLGTPNYMALCERKKIAIPRL